MRETYPAVDHRYDVWHVGKSISKKLDKAAKYADCRPIVEWTKSIVNHLYWCAGSTSDGNGTVIVAKWQSVVNHVHNVHTGHGQHFPSCLHDNVDETVERTKWIQPSTKASDKLENVILAKALQKDIAKLSPAEQTFPVEAFHSIINYFAPKLLVFSYEGMLCRLLLAALHYNENSQRQQATTADGRLRFCIKYPKFKKGGYSVRKIKCDSTHNYVQLLLARVSSLCREPESSNMYCFETIAPPSLCSAYEHPDKEAAVVKHISRFSK